MKTRRNQGSVNPGKEESKKDTTTAQSNKKRKYEEFKSGIQEKEPDQAVNDKNSAKRLRRNTQTTSEKPKEDSKQNNDKSNKKGTQKKAKESQEDEEQDQKIQKSPRRRSKSGKKPQETQQEKSKSKKQEKNAEKGKKNKMEEAKKGKKKVKKRYNGSDDFDEDDDSFSEEDQDSEFSLNDQVVKEVESSSDAISDVADDSDSFADKSESEFDDNSEGGKRRKVKAGSARKSNARSKPTKRRSQISKRPIPQSNEKQPVDNENRIVISNEEVKEGEEEEKDIMTTPKRNMYALVEEVKDGPWFTQKEFVRDEEGRRPDDPNYDPTTLFIPEEEFENMTPGMQRYWEIKKKNYDKIVFYRWGEWFILYFQDSMVCSKILDLCIPPRQMQRMIGFHQSHLKENIEKVVASGYKVAIAEQTETSKQMAKRISQAGDDNDLKVVRREIASIYSQGTFFHNTAEQDFDTKYVLAYCQDKHKFGFCYFDFSTLKFYLGSFEDDFTLKQFRTLCLQIRPVETICSSGIDQKSESMMILKNSHIPPSFTLLSMQDINEEDKIIDKFTNYFGEDHQQWPKSIASVLFDDQKKDFMASTALGLALLYLEQLLQAEVTIPVAEFYTQDEHNQELMKSGSMVIDAQAIEHLELLEVAGRSRNYKDGSFYSFISKGCTTPFGKRLLKRWVVGPLKDPKKINDRLDAVTDLVHNEMIKDKLQAKFRKLPDLERMLSKIYTYSQRSSVKAIYLDIAVISRLNEFYDLLNALKRMQESIAEVFDKDALKAIKSRRLKALVQFKKVEQVKNTNRKSGKRKRSIKEDNEESKENVEDEYDQNSIFPDYGPIIEEFEKMIQWKTVGSKKIPEPIEGLDEEFDEANTRVEKIKKRLDDYLENVRKELKSRQVTYTTNSKRYRYELEMPEDMHKKVTDDYINTSNVKGKKRYQTEELREIINELEEAEEGFKDALIPFLRTMFKKFYDNRDLFSKAVMCAAELDCLCTLAQISSDNEYGPMTRPTIIEDNEGEPYIELRQVRHPCVQEQMAKSSLISHNAPKKFIPNDIIMGRRKGGEVNPKILLITGPNMGGKSTLLRQSCLAAIMAQIGCYVPAESCKLTVVDRVFTRIGASDRILENKSTFFVELEETKTIVEQATKNSLVIMDELGRGTSTFDGYSIAHSVLTFLAQTVKCRTLFTTHYHMLVEDFKHIPEEVGLYHMKSTYEENSDKVQFLYKFIPGVAPQSFGIYVAKIAGINESVLEIARKKSSQFNTKIDQLTRKVREIRLKE